MKNTRKPTTEESNAFEKMGQSLVSYFRRKMVPRANRGGVRPGAGRKPPGRSACLLALAWACVLLAAIPKVHGQAVGTLVSGMIHRGSIAGGRTDIWWVETQPNDTFMVRAGRTFTTNSFTVELQLIGPDGQSLQRHDGGDASEVGTRTETGGRYEIRILDGIYGGSLLDSGEYALHLIQAPGTLTTADDDEGGATMNGGHHDGVIAIGDLDAWWIDTEPGESVILRVGRTTEANGFTVELRVFAPDGTHVRLPDDGGATSEIAFRSPAGGRYLAVIGDGYYGGTLAHTGGYRLHVVKTQEPLQVPPGDEGGPTTNGGHHDGRIEIGDLDAWWIDTQAGESVILRVGRTSEENGFTVELSVFAPDGAHVRLPDDGGATSEIAFRSPAGGRYLAVIGDGYYGGTLAHTGAYRLHVVKTRGPLQVPPGDEGGTLSWFRVVGQIETGDIDAYRFDVAEDAPIWIQAGRLPASPIDFAPELRLYGPDGSALRRSDSNPAEIRLSAPMAGSYTVVVGDSYGQGSYSGTGEYSLQLAVVHLRALEVTQSIQNWRNDIPLVAGKTTFVRAYLEAIVDDDATRRLLVQGRLSGATDGGDPVGSPLFPTGPQPRTRLVTDIDTVRFSSQSMFSSTLTFQLPHAWTFGDAVTLRLELPGLLFEGSELARDGAVSVGFTPIDRQKLVVVPTTFNVLDWLLDWSTGLGNNSLLNFRLGSLQLAREMHPIADFDLRFRPLMFLNLPLPGSDLSSDSLSTKVYSAAMGEKGMGTLEDAVYVMITPGTPQLAYVDCAKVKQGKSVLGFSTFLGPDLQYPLVWSLFDQGDPDIFSTFAHELGHVFGVSHPRDGERPTRVDPCSSDSWIDVGFCGETTSVDAPPFPSESVCILQSAVGLQVRVPGLGPRDFNRPEGIIAGTRRVGNNIVSLDPCETRDIMSYCDGMKWASTNTYLRVFSHLRDQTANRPLNPAPRRGIRLSAANGTASHRGLMIRGVYDQVSGDVDWLPILPLDASEPIQAIPSAGDSLLLLFDGQGIQVGRIPLDLHPAADVEMSFGRPFVVTVPEIPGVRRVELQVDGRIAGRLDGSPSAPTIELLPPSRAMADTNLVVLNWRATDPDGDALSHSLHYSRDDGRTWDLLAMDLDRMSLTIHQSQLPGGRDVRFRVTASDGFHVSEDVSDPGFDLPDHPPLVMIEHPDNGTRYSDGQLVFHAGAGLDLEDGDLPGERLEWISNRDGVLGTGQRLEVSVDRLSEGLHQIILIGRDSAGAIGSATNRITISRFPAPVIELASIASPESFALRVLGTAQSLLTVEVSLDVERWTEWKSFVQTNDVVELDVPLDRAAPHRFFRARSSQPVRR